MNHPGCFGLGIIHSSNPICKACPSLSECRLEARDNLQAINMTVDASDVLRHYADISVAIDYGAEKVVDRKSETISKKVALSADYIKILDRMAVKAREVAYSLALKGVDLKRSLQIDINPFYGTKHIFMKIACDALLKGSITKAQLKKTFMESSIQWREKTAESYVSIAFALFQSLEIVKSEDGKVFYLDRSSE